MFIHLLIRQIREQIFETLFSLTAFGSVAVIRLFYTCCNPRLTPSPQAPKYVMTYISSCQIRLLRASTKRSDFPPALAIIDTSSNTSFLRESSVQFTFAFDNCIVPMGFLPWEIRVAFPGESQLRHNRATQPTFCLLYTSPSPRDCIVSRMPSSA